MNRITWRDEHGQACYKTMTYSEVYMGNVETVIAGSQEGERLAAYEETGLEPKDIARIIAEHKRFEECWIWEEPGENHLESMADVMEVLIPARAIKELLSLHGINHLAAEIHKNAVAHGWYEHPRSFPEVIALMHSELSEALEEYRDGKPNEYYRCMKCQSPAGQICSLPESEIPCELGVEDDAGEGTCMYRDNKPEGIAIELADCIIRILDTCAEMGIDIERAIAIKNEYNKSRPYRHGGKKA